MGRRGGENGEEGREENGRREGEQIGRRGGEKMGRKEGRIWGGGEKMGKRGGRIWGGMRGEMGRKGGEKMGRSGGEKMGRGGVKRTIFVPSIAVKVSQMYIRSGCIFTFAAFSSLRSSSVFHNLVESESTGREGEVLLPGLQASKCCKGRKPAVNC